jgi:squamous cell carcinoma antigen recognized by T-cells 3
MARVETMDWPETLINTYRNHCELHESIQELRIADVEVRKATKIVQSRRQREAMQAQETAGALQTPEKDDLALSTQVEASSNTKRKWNPEAVDDGGSATKKSKKDVAKSISLQPEDAEASAIPETKRDRENSTIVVDNLPVEATELKVRQFFRDVSV